MFPPEVAVDSSSGFRRRQVSGDSSGGESSSSAYPRTAMESLFSTSSTSNGKLVSRLRVGESLQPIRQTAQDLFLFQDNVSGRSALISGKDTAKPAPKENRNIHKETQASREHGRSKTHHDSTVQESHRSTKHHQSHHHNSNRCGDTSTADNRNSAKQSRRRSTQVSCHECGRVSSPEWRQGPHGPGTLCNVCGLIYAKRESHRRDRVATENNRKSRH